MSMLIVSDFDGTLIDDLGSIPYSTVGLIDKLRRNGHKFAVATGRCLKSVLDYNKDFCFMDYIISSNGAYIYDTSLKKAIYKKNLLITNVRKIVKKYIDRSIIYVTDHNVWHLLSKNSAYEEDFDVIREKDYNSFLSNNKDNIYKIELYFKSIQDAKDCMSDLDKMDLKICANLQIDGSRYIVEVTHQEVNKLHGVIKVSKKVKCSLDEVIAFGDGYNDITLLKNVGYGIALENALDDVKKIAYDVTLDNNNKGVEEYLIKHFSK